LPEPEPPDIAIRNAFFFDISNALFPGRWLCHEKGPPHKERPFRF
jgi:hypothetical protein